MLRNRFNMRGRSRTGSFTRTQSRNRTRSGQGVTTQHDQRNIYRKKNMPRRKKRRWKKFKNKVNAIAEKELGTRTVVFNNLLNFVNVSPGNQCLGAVTLYGQRSALIENRDLRVMGTLENTADPTSAEGINVGPSTKMMFQSGVLDITVKNASGIVPSTPGALIPDGRAKLEVDVYEIILNEDTVEFDAAYNSIVTLLQANQVEEKPIGGLGATEVTIDSRGATPWDMTYSLSRFKIKILTKKKYFVPNQDTFTYQIRDPKRRVSQIKQLIDEDGFNRRGWTRCVLFIAKLVPGLTIGEEAGSFNEVLDIGCTRKYMYKVEGANDARSRYNPTA